MSSLPTKEKDVFLVVTARRIPSPGDKFYYREYVDDEKLPFLLKSRLFGSKCGVCSSKSRSKGKRKSREGLPLKAVSPGRWLGDNGGFCCRRVRCWREKGGGGGGGGRSRPGEKLLGAHGLIEALTEPWTKEFYRTANPRRLSRFYVAWSL